MTPLIKNQINKTVTLIKKILGDDLPGMYLYGSSIVGGFEKYSDIDLFVVSNRATTRDEKALLIQSLLTISGIYMKSKKRPIELTIVQKDQVNPWHFPPNFDFQYGEWLRKEFESGNIEPWPSKEMPDLALLITQILLANTTLAGAPADHVLCKVPYKDFMAALVQALPALMAELEGDVRNVLLTLARIWTTLATGSICSKPSAADWAIHHLPEHYRPVLQRAKAICKGEEKEHWDDLQELIRPCADFMQSSAHSQIDTIRHNNTHDRIITIAEDLT